MIPSSLLFNSDFVVLSNWVEEKNSFLLHLKSKSTDCLCPKCGTKSNRRHSVYIRKLKDLPWAGVPVNIQFSVRKMYCVNPQCGLKVFAERIKSVKPYARRTNRLDQQLKAIGFALGGNPGAKLACLIGMPISSSTLLRVIINSEAPSMASPKVIGVDDWAWKRGENYGTIIIDLEKNVPIDLLEDRSAETLKKWLQQHPTVEIISRDRWGSYGQGAKAGAPNAIQVADRWHLLKNLGDTVKKMLDKQNQALRRAATEMAATINLEYERDNKGNEVEAVSNEAIVEEKPLSKYELNFLEVKRLSSEGHSILSIFRQTGIHRVTIRKYLKYDEYPQRVQTKPNLEIADYEAHLRKRWQEGERNRKQLWREICDRGYSGSPQSVYRLTEKYPRDLKKNILPKPIKIKVWSARRVSLLLGKKSEALNEKEQTYINTLIAHCPKVKQAQLLMKEFKEMISQFKAEALDDWIQKAKTAGIPAFKSFAVGLGKDYDAVKAYPLTAPHLC